MASTEQRNTNRTRPTKSAGAKAKRTKVHRRINKEYRKLSLP